MYVVSVSLMTDGKEPSCYSRCLCVSYFLAIKPGVESTFALMTIRSEHLTRTMVINTSHRRQFKLSLNQNIQFPLSSQRPHTQGNREPSHRTSQSTPHSFNSHVHFFVATPSAAAANHSISLILHDRP